VFKLSFIIITLSRGGYLTEGVNSVIIVSKDSFLTSLQFLIFICFLFPKNFV